MRGNAHVRFGGRAGETERPRGRHRASVRPYYLKVREDGRVVSMAAADQLGVLRQLLRRQGLIARSRPTRRAAMILGLLAVMLVVVWMLGGR
jgi:hypothetical protein